MGVAHSVPTPAGASNNVTQASEPPTPRRGLNLTGHLLGGPLWRPALGSAFERASTVGGGGRLRG